ncbi:DUF4139 domain-containing protein [Frigidibacter sp. ROC022]|uniref:DUF4139 domain-containing protein n=1 Tax=Frigidibacter sp. ROC022 TaxID=2971796 RepID=UPI00215A6263|nr:DUF4139 domain-containing protein [Frigidibacter sp. ROC022]MCR8724231.1 DUF4139 domain-containing protein [Frigidibacter sp. ROC022]
MRVVLNSCLAVFLLAFPAAAETFALPSKVEAVTLYPWGAQVARRVEFTAPAGLHSLVIPDLPAGTPADALRIVAPEGVKVGAVALAADRQPATEDLTRPAIKAARAEVERLEAVLRDKQQDIALIRLRAEAADAQALFLRGVGKDGAVTGTAEEIRALAGTIGAEILAARTEALRATQEADAAERALKPDVEALHRARQALEALTDNPETATLTMTVQTEAEGPTALTVLVFVDEAGWRPVYDLRLTRGETDAMIAERGVVVSQYSGEDWLGVRLTLSTARPSGQSRPSVVYPDRKAIIGENERYASGSLDRKAGGAAAPPPAFAEEAPVVLEEAAVEMAGAIVTYVYPNPVDLRSGVEDLRLALDTLTLTPEVRAVAVPASDETAFVVATTRNSTPEVLLPGEAVLWLDGQLVGGTDLPLVAANDKVDIGFGPIDGLRLTRTVPNRSEGDTGFVSRSTQLDETALLTIENLTGEDWPIRVIDRVPYSEQDDLSISHSARPKPSEEDLDGKRGVLAWDFEIGAGTKQVIELSYSMSWPSGFVLE